MSRKKIPFLLVDFNKTSRQLLAKTVRQFEELEIAAPGNLGELLECLKESKPLLAVLDAELETQSIWDLLVSTEDQVPWDSVAKVLVSADTSPNTLARATEAGFTSVLGRPFTTAVAEAVLKPFLQTQINPPPAIAYTRNLATAIISDITSAVDLAKRPPPEISEHPQAMCLRAQAFFMANNLAEAQKILDGLLPQYPEYLRALTLQARVFTKNQQYLKAHEVLMKAIRLSPLNRQRLQMAPEIMIRSQQYSSLIELAELLRSGALFDPTVARRLVPGLIVAGYALASKGDHRTALSNFEMALDLSTKSEDLASLGEKAFIEACIQGTSQTIEQHLVQHLKGHEKQEDWILAQGFLDWHLGNPTRSMSFFLKLTQSTAWREIAYSMLAEGYAKLGQQEKIKTVTEEAGSLGIVLLPLTEIQRRLKR